MAQIINDPGRAASFGQSFGGAFGQTVGDSMQKFAQYKIDSML